MREMSFAESESPGKGGDVLEAAVGACQFSIWAIANLLGDALLGDEGLKHESLIVVPTLYQPDGLSAADFDREVKRHREVAMIFREWFARRRDGWVPPDSNSQ